ncbi:cell division cycle 5-like protein [Dorcoceras hygrometricum]|uniref:Cell division cycle 5-like protein n=1 Tax=Dorcoceras hygrometricum TaxID=472368 RepID=A0A2Z7BX29_9LAMI|nr:cell division cycle 5-like protein [Dorcoceras hygrometricum]
MIGNNAEKCLQEEHTESTNMRRRNFAKRNLPPPTVKCRFPRETGRSQAPRRQQDGIRICHRFTNSGIRAFGSDPSIQLLPELHLTLEFQIEQHKKNLKKPATAPPCMAAPPPPRAYARTVPARCRAQPRLAADVPRMIARMVACWLPRFCALVAQSPRRWTGDVARGRASRMARRFAAAARDLLAADAAVLPPSGESPASLRRLVFPSRFFSGLSRTAHEFFWSIFDIGPILVD